MDDQLGAGAADQSRETTGVHEAAPKLGGGRLRRMVQHDDAEKTTPGGFGEKLFGGLQLAPAQIPRSNEQGGRNARRQTDQGHVATHPQIREFPAPARFAACPWRESTGEIGQGAAHIGIVIARHETDILGRTQGFQPFAGELELRRKTNVRNVAGHRDMVWMMGLHVRDDLLKDTHIVDARAGACPVQIAGDTFADEFDPAGTRQRSEMGVGQMGKKNFHAGNLSAPRGASSRVNKISEQREAKAMPPSKKCVTD